MISSASSSADGESSSTVAPMRLLIASNVTSRIFWGDLDVVEKNALAMKGGTTTQLRMVTESPGRDNSAIFVSEVILRRSVPEGILMSPTASKRRDGSNCIEGARGPPPTRQEYVGGLRRDPPCLVTLWIARISVLPSITQK